MTSSTLVWAMNVLLETACLVVLLKRNRHASTLGVFVTWQFFMDLSGVALRPFLSDSAWSLLYWACQSVTYALIFGIFQPSKLRTLFGAYWLSSFTLALAAIWSVWFQHRTAQIELGLACGSLAAFAALVGFVSAQHRILGGGLWAGVAVWNAGQILAAALPTHYAQLYPLTCAAALLLFLLGLLQGDAQRVVPLPQVVRLHPNAHPTPTRLSYAALLALSVK